MMKYIILIICLYSYCSIADTNAPMVLGTNISKNNSIDLSEDLIESHELNTINPIEIKAHKDFFTTINLPKEFKLKDYVFFDLIELFEISDSSLMVRFKTKANFSSIILKNDKDESYLLVMKYNQKPSLVVNLYFEEQEKTKTFESEHVKLSQTSTTSTILNLAGEHNQNN